jgi:mannose-6-phosphate isomerase-like protein (cupin superfamily)
MNNFRFSNLRFSSAAVRQAGIFAGALSSWLPIAMCLCILSVHSRVLAQSPKATNYTRQQLMAMATEIRAQPAAAGHERDARERHLDAATTLAVRTVSGRAELHTTAADEFFVVEGQAELVTGGTIVNPQGSGEVRGDSILHGTRAELKAGDVVHIPAHIPHQMLLQGATPFVYVVIKIPAS